VELDLKERVALVTAASRGLGRAIATALASEGAHIVIAARGKGDLLAAEAAIKETGAEVLAIPADISDEEAPKQLVAATLERFGRIDIVISSNAGPPRAPALEISDEAMHDAFNANMLSSIRLVRESLPHMLESGWGRIVCIASYSILQAMPPLALSNAARSALWAWAKTAAYDLQNSGVTLNLACPGPHATGHIAARPGADQIDMQKLGDPKRFGEVVAFLCSDAAAYINGARIVIDGGKSLAL
jgi:3-oxoacyl-[acyl-carrier protein] reductase